MRNLERELAALLNSFSLENDSDTPDFILAKFLLDCLAAWNAGLQARDKWYGFAGLSNRNRVGGEILSGPCEPPDNGAPDAG